MTRRRSRRWCQLSLKSLFLLTLIVAAFFAGYSLATKQAEAERRRAELAAQRAADESRLRAEAELKQAQYHAAVARALEWAARQQVRQQATQTAPDDH